MASSYTARLFEDSENGRFAGTADYSTLKGRHKTYPGELHLQQRWPLPASSKLRSLSSCTDHVGVSQKHSSRERCPESSGTITTALSWWCCSRHQSKSLNTIGKVKLCFLSQICSMQSNQRQVAHSNYWSWCQAQSALGMRAAWHTALNAFVRILNLGISHMYAEGNICELLPESGGDRYVSCKTTVAQTAIRSRQRWRVVSGNNS